ncbi:hypothetical protein ACTXT7_017425 [Hymenolepis weldensis]
MLEKAILDRNDLEYNDMINVVTKTADKSDKGLADNAIRLSTVKAKRQVVMLKSLLRLKVLSIKTRKRLLEIFMEPVLLYHLFTTVCRKVDVN